MAAAALELRAILDSAEQAASVQDFVSAEHYLRKAATLQEAQLGANHPDLANTLNNLGIVCERTGNVSDAEACYRRAYAIARSTLPAEDPLVITSGQNLKDFCAATGRPFERAATEETTAAPGLNRPPQSSSPSQAIEPPPVPPAQATDPVQPSAPPQATVLPQPIAPPQPSAPPQPIAPPQSNQSARATAPPAPAAPPPPSSSPRTPVATAPPVPFPPRTPSASPTSPRTDRDTLRTNNVPVAPTAVPIVVKPRHRNAIWVVLGTGILLTLVLAFADRLSRSTDSGAPAAAPTVAPEVPPRGDAPTPPKQPSAPAAKTAPEPSAIKPAPERSAGTNAARTPAAPETRRVPNKASTPTGSTTVSLAESQLCRSISNWRCTPATSPTEPGVLIFYTRVKSASDTTVQHRWYLNGNLRRSVNLRIRANPGDGYRTYSRNTVAAETRGSWTIELRDAGGALLHEERFLVQ